MILWHLRCLEAKKPVAFFFFLIYFCRLHFPYSPWDKYRLSSQEYMYQGTENRIFLYQIFFFFLFCSFFLCTFIQPTKTYTKKINKKIPSAVICEKSVVESPMEDIAVWWSFGLKEMTSKQDWPCKTFQQQSQNPYITPSSSFITFFLKFIFFFAFFFVSCHFIPSICNTLLSFSHLLIQCFHYQQPKVIFKASNHYQCNPLKKLDFNWDIHNKKQNIYTSMYTNLKHPLNFYFF